MGKVFAAIFRYIVSHPEVIDAGIELGEKIAAAKAAKQAK